MLDIQLNFSGLTGTTVDGHIHCCTTTNLNAGVAIGFSSSGFPLGVTAGSYNNTFDLLNASVYSASFLSSSGGTAAQARDRLINAFGADPNNPASSRAYFNVHTTSVGSGEIRGNIAPVPEPSSFVLLVTCILAVAGKLNRRV
jgi:hypothetical protein